MFIITVCLRQSPTTLQFMFKEFKAACVFKNVIHDRRRATQTEEAVPEQEWSLDLTDDYGHVFDVLIEEVGAVVLKDLRLSNKAAAEIAMITALAQAELQAKVQRDPKMQFLAGAGGIQLPRNG